MYYEDLLIGHKAFWKIERSAKHYDIYMRELKNWEKWPDSVSIDEIEKLLQFISKWDRQFKGKNPTRFAEIFKQILPTIKELKNEKLENAKFTSEFLQKIRAIFDKVTKGQGHYESTDCSKILHTILPHLIVMWDRKIQLFEAINTCMEERKLEREEAIKYIRQECGNETLPKLIDEHNYVTHTETIEFKYYLEKNKEDGKISANDFKRLVQKLPSH